MSENKNKRLANLIKADLENILTNPSLLSEKWSYFAYEEINEFI